MNGSPFDAAQLAELDRRAESTAERIREALKDRLTFTPEERQALALFRELDAAGRAKALQTMAADARRAAQARPRLRFIRKGETVD